MLDFFLTEHTHLPASNRTEIPSGETGIIVHIMDDEEATEVTPNMWLSMEYTSPLKALN